MDMRLRYLALGLLLCFILFGDGHSVSQQNSFVSHDFSLSDLHTDTEKRDGLDSQAMLSSQTFANVFRHFKQQHPEYFILIEFFAENWSPALYKHLADSGQSEPWFIQTSFSPKRQRMNGWKDGNLLYKKGFFQAA